LFETDACPEVVTRLTEWAEREIEGTLRTVIDTPGLSETEEANAGHLQEMVERIKALPYGVKAIALLRPMQNCRFDGHIMKLMQLFEDMFNDAGF
jgi:hypothetical protein